MKAPFPWFGGKSRAAPEAWAALGDVPNYVEPFAGSLAVLLNRPRVDGRRTETVNDADGLLVNAWRAIAWQPDETARWVDWPVTEADLTARHLWLVNRRAEVSARVQADPEWCDPKVAGWWLWGICSWIGSGWCSGDGPWITDGQTVHLGNAGRGVHRKLPHLGNAGRGVHSAVDVFVGLTERLRDVRICCGDWSRVVTPSVTTKHGVTGVLLDPPYPEGWDAEGAYAGGGGVWRDVVEWAEAHGDDPELRIVVCGYEGTWTPPEGWRAVPWKARKGYQAAGNNDRERERLWLSPHCLDGRQTALF